MIYYTLLPIFSLLSLATAADPDFPIFCNSTSTGNCLQRVADSCYPCLHNVEFGCSGTGKDFDDCFCPIPSTSWTAFEACINDPSNGCADAALGEHLIYNVFATECNKYNAFLCQPGAKLDPVESKLAVQGYSCDATAAPTKSAMPTTTPASSATTTPAVSSTVTPGSTAAVSSVPNQTTSAKPTVIQSSVPTSNPSTTTPAVVVSGAGGRDTIGSGLVLAIAVAFAAVV